MQFDEHYVHENIIKRLILVLVLLDGVFYYGKDFS